MPATRSFWPLLPAAAVLALTILLAVPTWAAVAIIIVAAAAACCPLVRHLCVRAWRVAFPVWAQPLAPVQRHHD